MVFSPKPSRFHAPHGIGARRRSGAALCAFLFMPFYNYPFVTVAYAQELPSADISSPYGYADIADLATKATAVAVARIRSIAPVPPERAPGLPAGSSRVYVEAEVRALIRGDGGVAPRIGFLVDLPGQDWRKASRPLRGQTFILFGRASANPGQFQLTSSSAMLPWTPPTEAQVRGIVAETLRAEAPPRITDVAEAFHVRGTVAGESETQIFLDTESGDPVSLSIIRRPNMPPRFGAALGEIIDEAADVPPRDSLLWYRLACDLPAALPAATVAGLEPAEAEAARADYQAFLARLGECGRTLGNRGAPG